MHKEFWLTQDLPFYWRKKTNCQKFYLSRIRDFTKYYGKLITNTLTDIDKLNISIMNSLSKDRNAKSYMFFGWATDWVYSACLKTEETSPISYAPLQEIELVRYSYSMLPKGKRMNMFHRKLTTKVNKKVARVPTCYDTTASSEPLYMLRDVFVQGMWYAKMAVKYFARRFFKVSLFVDNVNLQNIDPQLRALKTSRDAVNWAKERGYLSNDATAENIPVALLGKMLNLHFLSQELGC